MQSWTQILTLFYITVSGVFINFDKIFKINRTLWVSFRFLKFLAKYLRVAFLNLQYNYLAFYVDILYIDSSIWRRNFTIFSSSLFLKDKSTF